MLLKAWWPTLNLLSKLKSGMLTESLKFKYHLEFYDHTETLKTIICKLLRQVSDG